MWDNHPCLSSHYISLDENASDCYLYGYYKTQDVVRIDLGLLLQLPGVQKKTATIVFGHK